MADAPQTPLDFASAGAPASATCSVCHESISSSYFTVGTQVACERCKSGVELALQQRPELAAYAKAVGIGSCWGLLGAAVWWGVRVATNYEIGLIAIAIGYFIGKGVRGASGGRGGLGFQLVAVALTYFWIAANYVPDFFAAFSDAAGSLDGGRLASAPAPVRLAVALLSALAMPFATGFENAIGLLIIGFGLYQAFALTKRAEIVVSGPFSISASGSPAASG